MYLLNSGVIFAKSIDIPEAFFTDDYLDLRLCLFKHIIAVSRNNYRGTGFSDLLSLSIKAI